MFGDSRPRSANQASNVLVAEGHPKQRAARVFASEFLTSLKQRHPDALVQHEI